MPRINTDKDFWNKVKIGKPEECWEWQGIRSPRGYGETHHFGSRYRAHRLAFYLTFKESPIAVCHKCDNPPCCNPSHLFAATNGLNNTDREKKGRSSDRRGSAHNNAKLNDQMVIKMRDMRLHGVPVSTIANEFKIHTNYARQIINKKRWSHI